MNKNYNHKQSSLAHPLNYLNIFDLEKLCTDSYTNAVKHQPCKPTATFASKCLKQLSLSIDLTKPLTFIPNPQKSTLQTVFPKTDITGDIDKAIQCLSPPYQRHGISIEHSKSNMFDKHYVMRLEFYSFFHKTLLSILQLSKANSVVHIHQQRLLPKFLQITISGQANNFSNSCFLNTTKHIRSIGGDCNLTRLHKQNSFFTLTLLLPVQKQPSGTDLNDILSQLQRQPERVKHVLYIEDDKSHIHLVESILKKIPGLSFSSAINSSSGVDLAMHTKPDLILLDIRLPDLDGYATFTLLQENATTCDIPVIGLSAGAMTHEVSRATKLGFKHYLTKPFRISELILLVVKELDDNKVNN